VYLQIVFWCVAGLCPALSLHAHFIGLVANHCVSLVAVIELGLMINRSFVRTQILDFKERILTRTRASFFG
jgi:hypothetical protein